MSTASTAGLIRNRELSARPFFQEQKTASADLFFVGYPAKNLLRDGMSINYSRRLQDKRGGFAGVAAINIDAYSLVADYDEAILGHRGLLEVIGPDNTSRAARLGSQQVDHALAPERLTDLKMRGASARFEEGIAFTDARNRYLGWHPVDGYPLVVVVGLDQQDYLGIHLERRNASINTAIGATLALVMFVFVAMVLSVRLAWKNHQLQNAHTTYRIATEGGDDGFFIVSILKDDAGRLANFCVIDCNEGGAAIFGTTRTAFVLTTLESWAQLLQAEALMAIFSDALSFGKAGGELELRAAARDATVRYLQMKAVRADANLAITLQDITYQRENLKMLERSSNEDMLTGLPNRAWAQKYLQELLANAARDGEKVALLFIDLDGFKAVNDRLGHTAGDEVLKHASLRLKTAIRPLDALARLGGDEFIVILRHVNEASDAEHVAQRIITAFTREFSIQQGCASLGTSIGISIFPTDAHDTDTLLKNADIAMYDVKLKGKNNFAFFNADIYSASMKRTRREAELRRAILDDEFVMHYQARLNVATGRTTSLEALVRWRHPTEGLVVPDEFIPLAEETGLILSLGELVISKVCSQVQSWQQGGEVTVPVSINVSSRQFNDVDVPKILSDAMFKHQIGASSIEIELTESTMITKPVNAAKAISALHAQGIKILIDDFGTGYSSLSMLHSLSFDLLKVDKSFTRMLGLDEQGKLFFSAIISMAHALGVKVVAEGVEQQQQLDILKRLGCDEVQGYYLAEPVEAPALQSEMFAVFA